MTRSVIRPTRLSSIAWRAASSPCSTRRRRTPRGSRPAICACSRRLGRGLSPARGSPAGARSLAGGCAPGSRELVRERALRGTLATDAVIGAWASPSTPGTGYVLFHHVMGETGGARGVWAYVEGGMGWLSEALAEAAREAGRELRTEAPVARRRRCGCARVGVMLEDGDGIEARAVVSGADPRRTSSGWSGRDAASRRDRARARAPRLPQPRLRSTSPWTAAPLPRPSGAAAGPEHPGTIHLGASSLDALDRLRGGLPGRAARAPDDRAHATLGAGPHPRAGGSTWPRCSFSTPPGRRDRAGRWSASVSPTASARWSTRWRRASPRACSTARFWPPDLERIFGLTGGNIFHGAMTLDRLLFMRPLPGSRATARPFGASTSAAPEPTRAAA